MILKTKANQNKYKEVSNISMKNIIIKGYELKHPIRFGIITSAFILIIAILFINLHILVKDLTSKDITPEHLISAPSTDTTIYTKPTNTIAIIPPSNSINQKEKDAAESEPKLSSETNRGGMIREESKIIESIPLSAELQNYAYDMCEKYDIPFKTFMALMKKESEYDINAISDDGRDFGLCQVRDVNYDEVHKNLGVTNLLDPKQNIESGAYILSKHIKKYGKENLHLSLMCYNLGPGNARKCWKDGIYSTKYSRFIINLAKTF